MAGSEELSLLNWFLAIPNSGDQSQALAKLRSAVESRSGVLWPLPGIPLSDLRVGTIDNLLALSENVGRVDAMARSLVQKIHRTYLDLEGGSTGALDVFSDPINSYITTFQWDNGKFNPREKLPELVRGIQAQLEKTAERVRSNHGKLQETTAAISAIERKKSGSLMTRPIRDYLDASRMRDGEYLLSVVVVVPMAKKEEFLASYDSLEESDANSRLRRQAHIKEEQMRKAEEARAAAEAAALAAAEAAESGVPPPPMDDIKTEPRSLPKMEELTDDELPKINLLEKRDVRTVVPDSVIEWHSDGESILMTVDIIRPGLEWFRNVCRESGFAVREFSFDRDDEKAEARRLSELKKLAEEQAKRLTMLCRTTFSDAFSRFIHLKIIRVFVEAVLRYGLPVDFSISVIKPPRGSEKSLLTELNRRYQHLLDDSLKGPAADSEVDFSGVGSEFYPFVYIPLKVDLF